MRKKPISYSKAHLNKFNMTSTKIYSTRSKKSQFKTLLELSGLKNKKIEIREQSADTANIQVKYILFKCCSSEVHFEKLSESI